MRYFALLALVFTLSSCGNSSGSVSAETCAAPETFSAIHKILFDDARKSYSGNVKYVNDMDRLFKATVDGPTLNDINKDTKKADCQGRLTMPVPSSLTEQFGREPSLTADIGYTVQPSADGKGFVYTLGGYNDILQRILNAATLLETEDKSTLSKRANQDVLSTENSALMGSGEVPVNASEFAGMNCSDLWYRRNKIYAENGYCFKSALGRQTFGNANCYTDAPDPPMYQQREISAIKEQEARLACKIK